MTLVVLSVVGVGKALLWSLKSKVVVTEVAGTPLTGA